MPAQEPRPQRLLSLDVFRGATIAAMMIVNNPGDWGHIYTQLDHAEWNGWTLTDLIFPFFLFITGVALALSKSKAGGTRTRRAAYLMILKRAALLFLFGLILNGFPSYDISSIRIMGVLQRISICYLFAAVLHFETGWIGQAGVAVSLLFIYWALMMLVPVPGVVAGSLEKGRNFSAYVDQLVLGQHVWANTKTWDPEGVVSTLPAISTTLFGVLTGHWLRQERPWNKTLQGLLAGGLAGVILGSLWNLVLPINKSLWTSSYSVFMAGLALLVLSVCCYLIEVRGFKRLAYPFEVFGRNAILVFMVAGLLARIAILWKVPFHGKTRVIKSVLYQTLYVPYFSPINASLAYSLSFLSLLYLVAWAFHKKRIYLKV
jgi:predicted acyltransferase